MRTWTPRLKALIGMLVLAFLGGCVASESSRYEEKLSARVRGSAAADGNVATAFGLNERSQPTTAVAGVSTDH